MLGRRRGSAPAEMLTQQLASFNKMSSARGERASSLGENSKDSKHDHKHKKRGRKEGKDGKESKENDKTAVERYQRRGSEPGSQSNGTKSPSSSSSPVSPSSPVADRRCSSKRSFRAGKDFGESFMMTPGEQITGYSNYAGKPLSGTLHKKSGSIKDYHLALLGQGGVGKSALLVRFTTGRFIHEYDPTLEMTYEVLTDIDDEPVALHILDTANTNEPVYLNKGEGFIVVYSITDRYSFETAKQLVKLIREVKKTKGMAVSIVLVGNKIDLKHERVIQKKEGREFASEYECAFHETTAANNINVDVSFHDVVRQLRLQHGNKKGNKSIKNFFSKKDKER